MAKHTDSSFENELRELKEKILKMGEIVEEMVVQSVRAIATRDSNGARQIIERDREVDLLEMKIDDLCLKILALRQPAASDLRFITVGLRISTDLERMGDLAENMGKIALKLNELPTIEFPEKLNEMAGKAQGMVKRALNAFVERDAVEARYVCELDDEVDNLGKALFEDLVILMENDPTFVSRGVRLISALRQIERVADHATNIGEEVIFMVKGDDVRHGADRAEKK